jgi:hypothetical protein
MGRTRAREHVWALWPSPLARPERGHRYRNRPFVGRGRKDPDQVEEIMVDTRLAGDGCSGIVTVLLTSHTRSVVDRGGSVVSTHDAKTTEI